MFFFVERFCCGSAELFRFFALFFLSASSELVGSSFALELYEKR